MVVPSIFDHVELDYGAMHPFEHARQRDLQFIGKDGSISTNQSDYQPLRIVFVTEPIEAQRQENTGGMIDLIVNEILPAVEETWRRYLSVYRVQGEIPLARGDCFGFFDDDVPEALYASEGIEGDLIIYVTGRSKLTSSSGESLDVCSRSTLAVASVCALDNFDRPVKGFINFCLDDNGGRRHLLVDDKYTQTSAAQSLPAKVLEDEASLDDKELADIILVAIHEVAHVLGVDFDMFKYFRDGETGEPRTTRGFEEKEVECVDGSTRLLPFPSETTLQKGTTEKGIIFYDLITPRVRQVVRNHYDCQTLPGARLENQPTSVGACVGSHFDERYSWSELLSPVFSGKDVLSPLTLALLEDSGFYRVFYEGSSNSPFGLGAGCSFVESDCIVDDAVPDYAAETFCSSVTVVRPSGRFSPNENDILCDPTHTKMTLCDLFDTTRVPSDFDAPFPDEVRYFSDVNLASRSPHADFCPLPSLEIGIDCTNPRSPSEQSYYRDEEYGPGSRCINARTSSGRVRPACLPTSCNDETRKVIIAGIPCDFDGQRHVIGRSASGFGGTLTCPKLSSVCPHLFCPAGCSGRGICNYDTNECECFDISDSSASCSRNIGTRDPSQIPPTPSPLFAGEPSPSSPVDGPFNPTATSSSFVAVSSMGLTIVLPIYLHFV